MSEDVERTLAAGHAATEQVADAVERKPDWAQVRRYVLVACLTFSMFTGAVAIGVSVVAARSVSTAAADAAAAKRAVSENRELATKAYDSALQANEELKRRGQEPVDLPPPDDTPETLVAAATASVLASLPPSPPPTPETIAAAVVAYMNANPITPAAPTPAQVFEGLAAYLAQNPPPSGQPGVPGEKGEKGDAPTAEQLQAAFVVLVQANPGILRDNLCVGEGQGQYRLASDVILADGSRISGWLCVTASTPPAVPPLGR